MSDDLVSLRILVVGASAPEQELWRQATGLASVPIEFATAEARTVVGTLANGGTDICVMDAGLSDDDKTKVVTAAQALKPAPLLFVAAAKGSAKVKGFDRTLAKPATLEDARVAVETCVRSKFPSRVLIVDDSGTMRSIVRKILSAGRFAMNIQEAVEGRAAVEQLSKGNFDIVFLDYNMPGLNGLETLSEIKRASPKVAVVIMTSSLEEGIVEHARALGAFEFLKKPFYPADIDTVVERYYGLNKPIN